jgi:large subunit ribosomal protein L24
MARRLKVGDTVQVISGKYRGKQGHVLSIQANRVRVDKVAMQKVHLKPGRKAARGGGILEREGTIDASNVMLVDSDSGAPSRIRNQRDETGKRTRVFAKSGKPVPDPKQK